VYSTTKKEWTEWPKLSEGVLGQSCVRIGDNIIMAGGADSSYRITRRTVIFDTKTGSARKVASLKYPRGWAGMELYGGKPVILGGDDGNGDRSDGEIWNMDTESWEEADIYLNIGRSHFSLVATEKDIKCD